MPVSIACSGGYTGGVTLAITGVPPGVNMTFQSSFIAWDEWGTMLTVAVDASTPPGSYPLTVTGTGTGVASQSSALSLTVTPAITPSITVGLVPQWLAIVRGQTGSVAITVARGGGYDGDVELAVSNVPVGVTPVLDPQVVPSGGSHSTVTISTAASATPGVHFLNVIGSAPGVGSISAQLTLVIIAEPWPAISVGFIPDDDFVWTIPGDAWAWPGVLVQRSGGYTGPVSLSAEGLPPNVTASFDPPVLGMRDTTSAVTFTATFNAALGESWVTIRARGDGVQDATTTFRLIVFPPWVRSRAQPPRP